GIDAYPFTPEKFVELDEIAKAKEATQTLESVLVSGDQDFVIKNGGEKLAFTLISDSSVRIRGEDRPPLLLSPLVSSMPSISSKTH
ncbi:putative nucleoredoxin 1-like, partial [Trifolium medium]|nr:putative nucleoredoxin 1-like [Trifolium medium]